MTLRSFLCSVALGARLASFRGYVSVMRALLVSAAVAGVTLFALAAASVSSVTSAHLDREAARAVQLEPDSDESSLRAVDPRLVAERLWNGHRVSRTYVASGSGPTVAPPPGMDRIPAAGEMYVSPALSSLLNGDEVIRKLFGESQIMGTIGEEGLVGPDELRAVVGVEDSQTLTPASGFGGRPEAKSSGDTRVNIVIAIFLVVLIAIPALLLVTISARMSQDSRRRRADSLRLLGASRWRVALLISIEVLMPAVFGTVAGTLAYSVARGRVDHIPFTNTTFYPYDVVPAQGGLLWIPPVVTLLVVLTAVCQTGARHTSTRQTLTASRTRPLWSLPLVVALIGLGAWRFAAEHLPDVLAGLGLWVLVALAAVGLASSGSGITQRIGKALAPKVRSPGTSLGLSMCGHSPGTAARLSGVLAVTLLAIGVSTPFVALLNGGSEARAAQVLGQAKDVVIVTGATRSLPSEKEAARWEGVRQVMPSGLVTTESQGQIPFLRATCEQLSDLSRREVSKCTDAPAWLAVDSETTLIDGAGSVVETRQGELVVPGRRRAIEIPGLSQDLDGVLKLSPGDYSQLPIPPEHRQLVLRVASAHVSEVIAQLTAIDPGGTQSTGEYGYLDPDQAQFPEQVQWVHFGSIACLALGILAIVAATLGDGVPRRRRLLPLIIAGAPRREVFRCHLACTGMPLATMGTIGSIMGWVAYQGVRGLDDRAVAPTSFYLGLVVAGLVVTAFVVLVTAPPLVRPTSSREFIESE
ncbi:MAG: hypothetical protein L0H93_12030 [Nocardioides sp.]|nr:hypothetical protein [Nocardioides sp.]